MTQFRIIVLSFVFILSSLPAQGVFADTGPKPGMEFEFQQSLPVGQVTILAGILYECNQSDCSDAAPLEQLGPQGLYCDGEGCRATAYGFAPYHILEVEFSDGVTRRSNIFETAGFDSKYTVTVRPDDLLVEAQFSLGGFPRTATMFLACFCSLAVAVVLIGLAVYLLRRSNKK